MKKLFLFPVLLLALCLGACTANEDNDMTIELACPKPVAEVSGNLVTITWSAIAKTAGYAYRFDQGEYAMLEADVLSQTWKMTAGEHTFEIYAAGNEQHTTNSAVRTISFVIDLELAAPVPTIETDGMNATISWEAVPNAVGYAYKVDNQAEVEVGDEVLSYSDKFTGGKHTFVIRALGDGVESTDSKPVTFPFDIVDTSVGVFLRKGNGAVVEIPEVSSGIFAADIDFGANESFIVLIDNVKHGFLAYGGNGGVGTVNSEYAALPFYKGFVYSVNESLGRLTKEIPLPLDKLNSLWVNTGAAAKVSVKIDCTNADGEPRYYMRLAKTPDSSLLLEQRFDLMIFGGDWTQPNKAGDGTKIPSVAEDGTEGGTPKSASYTTVGANMATVSAAYVANRGMTDWGISGYVFEFPGYIRLCNSSSDTQYGILTTPKLSSLAGASNITVSFEGLRFASAGNIKVEVLGAGTIASASVLVDGTGSAVAITPEADGKSFLITSAHGTKHPNDAAKTFSAFTIRVQGATAETQICWDTRSASKSGEARYCLDNIVIRKN